MITIKLYISTLKKYTSFDIAKKMYDLNIECQVYDNYSSIIHSCGQKQLEHGFCIYYIDVSNETFKDIAWPYFKNELDIDCAFVESTDYKGCIMNWPNLFRPSMCRMIKKDSNLNLTEIITEVTDG